MLFSLANLAAHAHCLLRFLALLRRLPHGPSPLPGFQKYPSGDRCVWCFPHPDCECPCCQACEISIALCRFALPCMLLWCNSRDGISLGRPGSPVREVRPSTRGPSRRAHAAVTGGGAGTIGFSGGSQGTVTSARLPEAGSLGAAYPYWCDNAAKPASLAPSSPSTSCVEPVPVRRRLLAHAPCQMCAVHCCLRPADMHHLTTTFTSIWFLWAPGLCGWATLR